MDLTIAAGRGPGLGPGAIWRIAAALIACHRWSNAMQAHYDRFGPGGFQRLPYAALTEGLED